MHIGQSLKTVIFVNDYSKKNRTDFPILRHGTIESVGMPLFITSQIKASLIQPFPSVMSPLSAFILSP
jgi:hypothetical protein